jgi:hypothetical protein
MLISGLFSGFSDGVEAAKLDVPAESGSRELEIPASEKCLHFVGAKANSPGHAGGAIESASLGSPGIPCFIRAGMSIKP